jgi:Raf kinase inhibitor-like YbhB/YbcL family protein
MPSSESEGEPLPGESGKRSHVQQFLAGEFGVLLDEGEGLGLCAHEALDRIRRVLAVVGEENDAQQGARLRVHGGFLELVRHHLAQALEAADLDLARTDFGAPGYGGPCPPQGDHPHRYLFTVFAVGLDSLPVNADTSAAVIGFQLNFNTLAKGAIMGLYKR